MSVSAQETVFHHVGNGQTVTFPFGCQVLQASDLQVYLNDVRLTSGFSPSGIGIPTGGAVTFDAAPADQAKVRIERVISLERTTDYQQNGDFLARVVNPDFNRIWMALQQHATMFGRALMAPKSDAAVPAPLPSFTERANKLLSFDAAGNPVVVAPAAQSATALQLLLANDDGAALSGFSQDDGAAVPTTVQEALRDAFSVSYARYMTDVQKVAVLAGADATLFLQAAIDALPAGGRLHGSGATFVVTSLNLKSDMHASHFNLKTKDGVLDFASPITIDGRASAKSDIVLSDIHIDGNRINQLAITATSEDGGRHGFRLVGQASRIYLERCSANYCAGDGIELFSSTSHQMNDAWYVFNDIRVRDSSFNWNRRHGMSGDSIKGLRMDNVELNYNGLDLAGVHALDAGGHAATIGVNSDRYGNGIDMEGYGIGSAVTDVRMRQVTALYNARGGCLFYDSVETRGANFVARSKLWFSDCYFDEGQDATRTGEALTFTSTIASKALAALYDSVYIENTRLDGQLLARGVSNLQFSGEIRATQGEYYAVLDNAMGVVLNVLPAGAAKRIYADQSTYSLLRETVPMPANPTLSFDSGAAGALANIVVTPRENRGNRSFTFLITADWTPTADGSTVLRLAAAAPSSIVDPAYVGVINNNTGGPVLAIHNPVSGFIRFTNAGAGVVLKLQILATVYQ